MKKEKSLAEKFKNRIQIPSKDMVINNLKVTLKLNEENWKNNYGQVNIESIKDAILYLENLGKNKKARNESIRKFIKDY